MATILHVLPTGETVVRRGQQIAMRWHNPGTFPVSTVIAELGNCGLDQTAARSLAESDAFVRAVKDSAKRRAASVGALNPDEDILLRKLKPRAAGADEICYQLTHEFRLVSGAANGYSLDATICLTKSTGIVDGSDKALAADIQAAIPKFQENMTFSDVNRMILKIIDRELGVCATAPGITDGSYYIPDATFKGNSAMRLLDSLQLFAGNLGCILRRYDDIRTIPAAVVPPAPSGSGTPTVPPPAHVPTPCPLPSSPLPPSGDDVADSYHSSLCYRLGEIEERVLKYQSTSYKHMKRAESVERGLRDDLRDAMEEIDTLGREGYLGVYWIKFEDYRAGIEYLLANPTANTGAASVPVVIVDAPRSAAEVWANRERSMDEITLTEIGEGMGMDRPGEVVFADTAPLPLASGEFDCVSQPTSNVDFRGGIFAHYEYASSAA